MQEQRSLHQHSPIPPLLPPDASPAPSPHTQVQVLPKQDWTHRVRTELSGSAASRAQHHPRDLSLVLRVCQSLAGQTLGMVPETDSPC